MLDWMDHVASIATAAVAVVAYGQYLWRRWANRRALEAYLASVAGTKAYGADKGTRSLLHLVAKLRLTEQEIFQAAFTSKKIDSSRSIDPETGDSFTLMFSHKANRRT